MRAIQLHAGRLFILLPVDTVIYVQTLKELYQWVMLVLVLTMNSVTTLMTPYNTEGMKLYQWVMLVVVGRVMIRTHRITITWAVRCSSLSSSPPPP
jgi:hypothetical protein